jgi:hypothetical protein
MSRDSGASTTIAEQLVPPSSFFIFSILYDFVLPRFYSICGSTHKSSSLLSLLYVLLRPYSINIYISEEIYELFLLIGFESRLLLMQSVPSRDMLCSGCARPWQSTQFKTCDDCRRKASLRALASRQYMVATGEINRSTALPPTAPPPAFSTLRVSCSQCVRPWQSTRYETCDRCRGRAIGRRTISRKVRYGHSSTDSLTLALFT